MCIYRMLAIRFMLQTVPVVLLTMILVRVLLNYCGLEANGYGLDVLNYDVYNCKFYYGRISGFCNR